MALYLYKFNNYYNRILKRFDSLADYGEPVAMVQNTNFNPNDEISASHIVNFDGGECDYAINTAGTEILNRWYIIEKVRVRAGQYQLTLFRDTLADYLDELMSATTYIEKAWITNPQDPAVYNLEDFSVNQIKVAEGLIKDKTKSAWIVGYYDKKTPDDFLHGPVNLDLGDLVYTSLDGGLDKYNYYSYLADSDKRFKGLYDPTSVRIRTKAGLDTYRTDITDGYAGYLDYFIQDGSVTYTEDLAQIYNASLKFNVVRSQVAVNSINAGWKTAMLAQQSKEAWLEEAGNYVIFNSETALQNFLEENNKLLKTSDGEFYRVHVIPAEMSSEKVAVPSGNLFNSLSAATKVAEVNKLGDYGGIETLFTGSANTSTFEVLAKVSTYKMTYERVQSLEAQFDFRTSLHESTKVMQTDGCPYNIFAIPYNSIRLKYPSVTPYDTYGEPSTALAIASSIQRVMDKYLYDIQLLPYFPIPSLCSGRVITLASNELKMLSFVSKQVEGSSTPAKVYPVFNVPYASFALDYIYYPMYGGSDALDKKIKNQCTKWRICSPNYANYFDFSVVNNDGVDYMTVDCDYKPWTPYIHINPNFKGLYGQDFNDPRGLILGGDFSLTQVIDQWQTYQVNNKNYELIFGRQIQNMEVQHKYAKVQDYTNMVTGTLSAAGTGFAAGMLSGNPLVAGIGAGVSGLASLAAGIGDVAINQKLRDEAKDYTIDMYNLQLQNIQALPTTLSKVSAFNPNNKIFPVIEEYECTEIEKEAFKNKLLYNGMTINRIGKLEDFIVESETPHYYKGQLIRIDLNDDFHLTNTIASELRKGVFI